MKQYWLLKSEPSTYSWADLLRDGQEHWDGIRNYQARNNLNAMHVGDEAFFYHSMKEKAIQGTCKVVRTAYPDHTFTPPAGKERQGNPWMMVDVSPVRSFKRPVTLGEMKATPALHTMALLKQSRLSVVPVTPEEWQVILGLEENLPVNA